MYQLTPGNAILRLSDNALIPEDPGNRDYREYLDWLAAGNTPEPPPDNPSTPNYLAFWEALLVSDAYTSIRQQSMVSLPVNTLATEFIALIGDAKAGRANQAAIQQSILAILSTGTFSPGELESFVDSLVAGNLDEIYTLPELP